eukprot:scaffold7082_cov267-Chaetoceros_neogracile.AAC.5
MRSGKSREEHNGIRSSSKGRSPPSFCCRLLLCAITSTCTRLSIWSFQRWSLHGILDRITGPKLFKTVTNWNGIHSVPLVPLRILTGLLVIHHGSEGGVGPANFGTPEFQGFVDYIMKPRFGFLPGSPEIWAAIHDYAEFYGGIFFALGFLTRPEALSLLVTMLSAVCFHLSASGSQGFPLGHVSNYSYDFEEPLLYALIFLEPNFQKAVEDQMQYEMGSHAHEKHELFSWA